MYRRQTFILLVFLLMLSACAPAATQRGAMPAPAALPAQPALDQSAPPAEGFAGGTSGESKNSPLTNVTTQGDTGANRLVIRNANLTIVVDDPASAMTTVNQMAEKMGGYVVASNLFKTSGGQGREYPEASITVRVPAEKLNEALAQIKALVKDPTKDIQAETISGQDVTKEYTDLQSRLTNLQDTEAQLREIMASTTKTEDVLAVYNQLTQVREQIEVLKGQIQYYKESAALSAIAVQIKAQASVQPLEIGGWQPVGVARNALQALIDTLKFLASAAIWIILFLLPVALVIFLPLYLVWRLIRRNRKGKKQAPPPSATPPTPA
jgi:hypothetical protein